MLYSEVARYYEELGEDLSLSNIISTNELLGYRALLKFGSEQLREKYLPRLATGEILAAWCLGNPHYCVNLASMIGYLSAEESSGSDPSGVAMTATVQDDCYVLSGKKSFVTNAENSQVKK